MRLKPFLQTVKMDESHWNGLRRHENLPFVIDPGFSGWVDLSLEQAAKTRVMLDLMGHDHRVSDYLAGLPPAYAAKIVINAGQSLLDLPHGRSEPDIWIGVLILADETAPGGASCAWYRGTLTELSDWVAGKEGSPEEPRMPSVRLFLVNASESVRGVRVRANEWGVL